MPDPSARPAGRVATYRWQLEPNRGFAAAADAAPALARLGVSHLYLSPLAEAVPGSSHGYDVTDPTEVREALGGREGFTALADACRSAGLSLVLDIVPNHLATHEANPIWWDVLRLGEGSRWSGVLDIDWASSGDLVLPVLGDHYGRELEAGTLVLTRGDRPDRVMVVRHHERAFPLRPEAEGAILAEVARGADDDVLGVAARLLARAERPGELAAERDADLVVAGRTVIGRLADPAVTAALDAELAAITADPDRLDLVLQRQHYRLARWTVADAEVDYRRFFDVDSLIATRMEGPETFDLLHRLPAELLALDVVDGLRVDHVDGLADPAAYLAALRSLAGPEAWLLVEKIVRSDEPLPPWPIAGTTGYEVAELLGAWSTDPVGAEVICRGWAERVGETQTYGEVALAARREVLHSGFVADLDRVVDVFRAVCWSRRRHRDHTRDALRAAIAEVAVHLPRYRTYVAPDAAPGDAVTSDDLAVVHATVSTAKAAAPDLDPELFDLLAAVLTGAFTGEAERLVVIRFQQLSGPLAAKGEEDTALYRWLPLPHRCEVGSDPGRPTATAQDWHAACVDAQVAWPERMTTLSTHDTKRSADARARLAAFTAAPDALLGAFDLWWATVGGPGSAVDARTGWLTFHALAAAWPIDADRAWPAIRKSVREAGLVTTWTRPDEAVEAELEALVSLGLDDPAAAGLVQRLVEAHEEPAAILALAQLLAQLLAPGVPDLHQGAERWDRSLVDPDNRRWPDDGGRADWVAAAVATDAAQSWADAPLRRAGLPRAIVVHRALQARRRHHDAVGASGAYGAVAVVGTEADHVLAFTRGAAPTLMVVVARPSVTERDADVLLPDGQWTDVFTGASSSGRVGIDKVLAAFPVALLER